MTKTFRHRPAALLACCLALTALIPAARAQDSTRTRAPQIHQGRGEFEMVLIHGLGGNAAEWDEVTPYLQGTFNVYTFELGGHGKTRPIDNPSITAEVHHLERFIKENGVVYPTLVGHGLGGMIALQYALDHPADVHRLIVMDSAPRQMIDTDEKAHIADLMLKNYDRFVAARYLNMSNIEAISEKVMDTALRTDSASFISLLMSSFDFDLTKRLRTLSVPLLVIGSEQMFPDPDTSQQVLQELGWANARSLTFKRMETGHYMMLERPVYLASVLMAFGVTADYDFGH